MAAKARSTTVALPKSLQVAMLLAVVGGLLFISPYLGTVLFSALIAFVFNPVYKATLKRTKKSGIALITTLVVATLSFLIPLLVVVSVTVSQANTLVTNFQQGTAELGPAQIDAMLDRGTARINNLVRALPGGENFEINKAEVKAKAKDAAAQVAKDIASFITSAGSAFVGFTSTAILAIFLITAMLRYQAELIAFIKTISPFRDKDTSIYLDRAGAMTIAMVKGQLIIAVAQGFASAMSLRLVGGDYFWFFFTLLTFMSFIPLGAGIITIPIGVVIILTGNFWQGLFVILFHLIVVTNIDNILRPRLVPPQAKLNSALLILSVFSAIVVFGPVGVIYGPVIMITLITTFQMYADYSRRVTKPLLPSN